MKRKLGKRPNRCVGGEVEPAGRVHRRVAAARDVDHRRHVELAHDLVDREPVLVGQRRMGEMPATRIGVEVAADEAELLDAAAQLADARGKIRLGALRQHAHAGEPLGIELGHAVDQVVAGDRPRLADRLVADMVRHRARPRREDRVVAAAFLDQAQLVGLDRLADLVVGDRRVGRRRLAFLERGLLRLAPLVVRGRSRRVVAVAVDDQRHALSFLPLPLIFAARRWSSAVPRVITGSIPSSSSVRADSSISAARRSPWVSIRSRL